MFNASDFIKSKSGIILKSAVSEDLQQSELNEILLPDLDIETLRNSDALLLAYAKQRRPDLDFGESNEARLKGLIRYHQFQNLNQMSFFSDIVQIINKEHIVPLLHYDVAFKVYIPDYHQVLYNTAIIIETEKQYSFLQKKFQEAGYVVTIRGNFFIITAKEPSQKRVIVFNSFLFGKKREKLLHNVFSRAKEEMIFHTRCFIPSVEDLICGLINEICMKLKSEDVAHGLAFDIWNLYTMKKKYDISWDKFKSLLIENNMIAKYNIVGSFVNDIIADLVPMDLFDEKTISSAMKSYVWHERAVYIYLKVRCLFFK